MKLSRHRAIAAAALLMSGAGGAAFAHPHPGGDGKKVERFVIIQDGEGREHDAKGKGERVRRFEIIRDGKGEHHAHGPRVRRFEMRGPGRLIDCDGGEKIEESAGDGRGNSVLTACVTSCAAYHHRP